MTDMTPVARPYAKAVFEFAVEHRQLDVWANSLECLTQIILDPLCTAFITEPATTPEQHCQLIESLLKRFKITCGGEYLSHFIILLAHNKRLLAIASICQQFLELRANYEKTLAVDVISFSDLTQEQATQLTKRLSRRLQREVTLNITIDPAILGGAIIRAGDMVFDGSVRTQIKNLSNALAA